MMSTSNAQPTLLQPPLSNVIPHESRFTEFPNSPDMVIPGGNDLFDHYGDTPLPLAPHLSSSQKHVPFDQDMTPRAIEPASIYPLYPNLRTVTPHPLAIPSPSFLTEEYSPPPPNLVAPRPSSSISEDDPLLIEVNKETEIQCAVPNPEADKSGVPSPPQPPPPLHEMPYTPLAEAQQVDPQIEFANYRNLFMGDRQCRDCGAKIPQKQRHELIVTSNVLSNSSLLLRLDISCPKCSATFCRGCSTKVQRNTPRFTDRGVQDHTVCCGEAAALALFEVLSSLDRAYLAHVQRISFFKGLKGKAHRLGARMGLSRLIRRSKGFSISDHALPAPQSPRRNSILSLLSFNDAAAKHSPPGGVPMTMEKRWHACLVSHLHAISEILSLENAFTHPSIRLLLSLSLLPEVLLGLLRNDCVTDLNEWSTVLREMLQLITQLATNAPTKDILMSQRFIKKRTIGLRDYVWKGSGIEWEVEGVRQPAKLVKRCVAVLQLGSPLKFSTSRPLFHYLFKMSRQCEIFIHGVEPPAGGDAGKMGTTTTTPSWNVQAVLMDQEDDVKQDADLQSILALCHQVVDTKKHVLAVTSVPEDTEIQPTTAIQPLTITTPTETEKPQQPEPSTAPAPTEEKDDQNQQQQQAKLSTKEIDQKYSQMCELKSFEYVSLETESPFFGQGNKQSHYFSTSIASSSSSRRNPKDRLQMLKQLSVLSTSLPDGIWVRVDDVRSDVLKALIAGPVSTPYEGGLFEFDIFIPIDFPRIPPQVQLRTTGNGSVRFNPNLYHDGKVCLSLLGTWEGSADENWRPNTSTILQVLISIQSLIMVEHPYFNEPGRGAVNPKDRLSIEYSENIRTENIRWAMLDWMEKVRDGDGRVGIWSDVIAAHFTIYRKRIRAKVQEWASIIMVERFDDACDAMEKFRVRTTE